MGWKATGHLLQLAVMLDTAHAEPCDLTCEEEVTHSDLIDTFMFWYSPPHDPSLAILSHFYSQKDDVQNKGGSQCTALFVLIGMRELRE